MEFFMTDLNGLTLINPSREDRLQILKSVAEEPDSDYPEVYLTTNEGTVIGYRTGGVLFQEEDGEIVRIITDASVDAAEKVWTALATGREEALDELPWDYIED
jgi:hypothetical protein